VVFAVSPVTEMLGLRELELDSVVLVVCVNVANVAEVPYWKFGLTFEPVLFETVPLRVAEVAPTAEAALVVTEILET
jgi:hypothetical protein